MVTGGYAPKNTPKSEAPHKAFRRVQRYNLAGSLGRLPDLGRVATNFSVSFTQGFKL